MFVNRVKKMQELLQLTPIQQNILISSIIGDGEITKLYKNSRRKNHSYREHFGVEKMEYRKWKVSFFDGLLYITQKSHCVHHLLYHCLQSYILSFIMMTAPNIYRYLYCHFVHYHIFFQFYIWMTVHSASLHELTSERKKSI
jgi:hypothetical protein